MDLDALCRILDDFEPGMSIAIPKDWFSLHVEGSDEIERDVRTIELVLEHNCTWERNPETGDLTFTKQAPTEK